MLVLVRIALRYEIYYMEGTAKKQRIRKFSEIEFVLEIIKFLLKNLLLIA